MVALTTLPFSLPPSKWFLWLFTTDSASLFKALPGLSQSPYRHHHTFTVHTDSLLQFSLTLAFSILLLFCFWQPSFLFSLPTHHCWKDFFTNSRKDLFFKCLTCFYLDTMHRQYVKLHKEILVSLHCPVCWCPHIISYYIGTICSLGDGVSSPLQHLQHS